MILDISLKISKMNFREALQNTKYGDSIIYHVGSYADGKHRQDAMEASNSGHVALVQKKISRNMYQFLAQRSKKKVEKR
tara:strand:+ start:1230 stop:1466 length:237 start_codon:yes stop_codon:yes gene_type:complete